MLNRKNTIKSNKDFNFLLLGKLAQFRFLSEPRDHEINVIKSELDNNE